jgi:hypothetical protein
LKNGSRAKNVCHFAYQIAKLWDEILDIIKDNKDAEALEDDFTEHYLVFFHKLQTFCEECKVPKRNKSMALYSNWNRGF